MDAFSYNPSEFNYTTADDDYLNKLLSFDQQGVINSYPSTLTTTGLSPPENDSTSASASPESTTSPQSQARPSVQSAGHSQTSDNMVQPTQSTADTIHHDKRKTTNAGNKAGALKDRRTSNSIQTEHSHDLDDDNEADNDQHDDKGNKLGKTSERRKLQNRQAQRNFRERKEKHLKELEERVLSLEQQSSEQANENSALKQLLERLQNENERLKVFENAFSFTYDKDVSNSAAMPTSNQFKPPTPPTVQDEISDLSSFNGTSFGGSGSAGSSRKTSISSVAGSGGTSGNSPSGPTNFTTSANLFSASPSTFGLPPSSSTTPFSASPGVFDETMFFNSMTSQGISSGSGSNPGSISGLSPASAYDVTGAPRSQSSASPSSSANLYASSIAAATTPSTATADLFSAYRDNNFGIATMTSLSDFDNLFGASAFSTTSPPLANTQGSLGMPSTSSAPQTLFDDYIVSPSPPIMLPSPARAVDATSTPPSGPAKSASASSMSCPYGLDAQAIAAAVGPGGKYEFDLDSLCTDMKLKATCQEAAKKALADALSEDAKSTAKTLSK